MRWTCGAILVTLTHEIGMVLELLQVSAVRALQTPLPSQLLSPVIKRAGPPPPPMICMHTGRRLSPGS